MSNHVDLTNLHEMTDNDSELEKQLFNEFISSFEAGLDILRKNCDEGSSEAWRSQAHGLKGIAVNLGAKGLGDICKLAQEKHQSSLEEKNKLLNDMDTEYGLVKQFLLKQ